jgi:hypothetical protein
VPEFDAWLKVVACNGEHAAVRLAGSGCHQEWEPITAEAIIADPAEDMPWPGPRPLQ